MLFVTSASLRKEAHNDERIGGFFTPTRFALLSRSPRLTRRQDRTNASQKFTPTEMKFRDHSALKYKGFRSWPPLWLDVNKTTPMISGEVGVLTDARLRDSDPCRLFLTIEHEDGSFVGVLFFD